MRSWTILTSAKRTFLAFRPNGGKISHEYPTIHYYKTIPAHPNRIEGGLRLDGKVIKRCEQGRPLVSIITIVFNGEKTLEQTIQSVLYQTYDNIEYIIIDGGSTDSTLDIIRRYDDKIAYSLSEPDEGISDAFNKGISAATGEIIGIINADDWYNHNAVEIIVREYSQHGKCIFHGKLQYWTPDMKPYYVFSGNADKILIKGTINHPTVFVPRKIYEETGLFNTNFKNAMDYEWLIRAKLKGAKFYYIDKVISNMRLAGKSDKKWLNNYIEIFRARHLNGMNLVKNSLLFLNMVIVTVCRKIFEFVGLNFIVRIYRKHFSAAKKEVA